MSRDFLRLSTTRPVRRLRNIRIKISTAVYWIELDSGQGSRLWNLELILELSPELKLELSLELSLESNPDHVLRV